jgi:hypothetical protein
MRAVTHLKVVRWSRNSAAVDNARKMLFLGIFDWYLLMTKYSQAVLRIRIQTKISMRIHELGQQRAKY